MRNGVRQVDRSLEPFSWAPVDLPRVLARLRSADLSEEKVMERLAPALKRYQETLRQPRITEYLTAGEGDVAVVRSARMQAALRGLRGEPELERAPEARPARRRKARRRRFREISKVKGVI